MIAHNTCEVQDEKYLRKVSFAPISFQRSELRGLILTGTPSSLISIKMLELLECILMNIQVVLGTGGTPSGHLSEKWMSVLPALEKSSQTK
jgi:hypothetical protein